MFANLIVALYMLLPITLLTSHSLPSAVFYSLTAASLVLLAQKRLVGAAARVIEYRWLIASYSVLFFAIVASSLHHGHWAGANSEGALRLFLGLWILILALAHIDVKRLQHAIWGVYGAGLISTGVLLWLIANVNERPVTPGIILVSYTSIMLLLCAVTIFSLRWQLTARPRLESAVKIGVAGVIFAGFLIAQTRTGLLGLPLFVLLGLILFVGVKKPRRLIVWIMICGAVLGAALASNDAMRGRIIEGVQEVRACHGLNSTEYSSMCIRLQMWRTAINAGMSNPWFGLGSGGQFSHYMQDVAVPKGMVAQEVVDQGFGEPHSDLLLMFAGFGFPGVLGLLLIYLAPCGYFLPRLLKKETSLEAKAAAAMGLALCLGFLLFGLTETMFRRMNTMGFYVATMAWFMVLSETEMKSLPSRER